MSTPLRRVPWWGWALMAGAVFMFLGLVVALGLAAWVVMDVREPAEAEPIDCVELTNAIACVQVDLTQVGDEVDAHYLDIAVLSDDDGVAEVRMSAFTV